MRVKDFSMAHATQEAATTVCLPDQSVKQQFIRFEQSHQAVILNP
jgi:hypothetical protein